MLLTVQGAPAYCHTGGRPFHPEWPTVVFIHGAQNDHSVWAAQAPWFAHNRYSVLVPDLPAHGRSKGAAKASVGAMAAWLLDLLDAAGVGQTALVGHSMGSLIALETARLAPQRVHHLALLGSACPMKVSAALLETARHDEAAAIDMVNLWSHSPLALRSAWPGFSTMGVARRLMQRIPGLLHTDLAACDSYADGEAAARSIGCPTLILTGARDMMTPPKAARPLAAAIPHSLVLELDSGHALMSEQPDAVRNALFSFIGTGGPRP